MGILFGILVVLLVVFYIRIAYIVVLALVAGFLFQTGEIGNTLIAIFLFTMAGVALEK